MLFVYFRQASKNVNVEWREPAVRMSKGKIYNMRRELMITCCEREKKNRENKGRTKYWARKTEIIVGRCMHIKTC